MDPNNLALAQSFIESHVETAARELEAIDPDSASAFMLKIPLPQAQRLLMYTLPVYSARLLVLMPAAAAANILEAASSNQIAAVLRLVAEPKRLELLQQMPNRIASRCRRLLRYSEDTVGAWMTSDILLLPSNITASGALQRISSAGDIGDDSALPLVNNDQKLIGHINIRDLLRAKSDTLLSILKRESRPFTLSAKMSLRMAEQHEGWQYHDNLMVLNPQGQPEGLLRHCTLRRGMSTVRAEPHSSNEAILSNLGQTYLGSIAAMFDLVVGSQSVHQNPPLPYQDVPQ